MWAAHADRGTLLQGRTSTPPSSYAPISSLRWQFFAGIVLAAVGGMMVTLYKPGPGKPGGAPASAPGTGDTPVETPGSGGH